MHETTISILGFTLVLRYDMYDRKYISWSIKHDEEQLGVHEFRLLDTLLRMHYNEYIESQLREHWFQEDYEEHLRCSYLDPEHAPDIPF
jgi:hypothetical protein